MMNSYHYCYYYCYGYDDYPSYCCCSIILNDFLSLDEHDMLHLETPLLFAQCSWERLFKWKTPSTLCYLHPAIDFQTSLSCVMDCYFGFSDHGFHQYDSITWAWCSCRLTSRWPPLFLSSVWTMHTIGMLLVGLFQPHPITSSSDCLLSQQDFSF